MSDGTVILDCLKSALELFKQDQANWQREGMTGKIYPVLMNLDDGAGARVNAEFQKLLPDPITRAGRSAYVSADEETLNQVLRASGVPNKTTLEEHEGEHPLIVVSDGKASTLYVTKEVLEISQ